MASGNNLTSVVYKAGHHGSDSSSSNSFLTKVAPKIAVISSGADNRYGHPHPAVLRCLADVGAAVLRSDELGTIEGITDG
ncbi:MAG: hypothetical protein BMS9Abin02_2065 [Anaerolineae bacterium]|nr:MAG: hypothetical protein BMS9Abin02_2065 [Anaerolineae bacterium]